MRRGTDLSRDAIIAALTAALRPLPFVHAFYEGGSAAFNRVDSWSDIDLYIVVDDGAVPQTFLAVENTLASLSPIRINQSVSWPPATGIHQRFYHLEGSSEFLVVDLAVLTASAPDKFLVREIHGDPAVLFDKDGTTRPPAFDKEGFVRGLLERRRRLAEQMELFGPFVKKELLRGNALEAIEFYRGYVLRFLVEALRMGHGPMHYDFRMRYVHRELPPDVVRRLEELAFVKDTKDLAAKYDRALAWFHEVLPILVEEEIRRRVFGD